MAITPPVVVAGVQHTPLPFGLFSVVPVREDTGDRWAGGGVTFENLGGELGDLKAIAHDCDPGESGGLPRDLSEGGQGYSSAEAFSVFESYQCSPVGNRFDKASDVASQRLIIREEARVEEAIAHGGVGLERTLTGEAQDLGNLGTSVQAVAELEQLMATTYGSQGIMHMSRETATLAIADGAVEVASGGRLRTVLRTPVVAGTGYHFDGIIATSGMFAYRGDAETFDGASMLDRGTNDLYAVAERPYLVAWEDEPVLQATFTSGGGGSGMPGASAYEIAVENGFDGSEEEWLESLRGPRGNPGNRGPAPEVTWDGTTIVVDGEEGPDLKGEDGADGSDGTNGTDGVDGIVQAIVAGDGITVDASDPAEPIISASE